MIGEALALLPERPFVRWDASGIGSDFRKLPAGSHVLYHGTDDGALDVIRILHRSMDAGRHM
jgi:plasmid stabilization system protein ParE